MTTQSTSKKESLVKDKRQQDSIFKLDTKQPSSGESWFTEAFGNKVIGQPEALDIASRAYTAAHNPLRDMSRPLGTYFLIGPSRTGKSYTAETLALLFHGDKDALTRLQAGDYEHPAQVLDLKGAPPMFTGYKDPTDKENKVDGDDIDPTSIISTHNLERVRKGSQSKVNIVVIDEFEKAHMDFFKLWMGVFDKGMLRLGNGQEVDFTNTIFILTSNLGMGALEKMVKGGIGFNNAPKKATAEDVKAVVNKALDMSFPPEFRNRIDAVVIFRPLSNKSVRKIVDSELSIIQERIDNQLPSESVFKIEPTEAAKDFILNSTLGNGGTVADLKRVMDRQITVALGRELEKGTVNGGDAVLIDYDQDSHSITYSVIKGGADSYRASSHNLPNQNNFDYRLKRAQQLSDLMLGEGYGLSRYEIRLQSQSVNELFRRGQAMIENLQKDFQIKVTESRVEHETLPVMGMSITTMGELAELIREKYPQATVLKLGN